MAVRPGEEAFLCRVGLESSTRGQHVHRAWDRKESALEPCAVDTWALGDVAAQRITLTWGASGQRCWAWHLQIHWRCPGMLMWGSCPDVCFPPFGPLASCGRQY